MEPFWRPLFLVVYCINRKRKGGDRVLGIEVDKLF